MINNFMNRASLATNIDSKISSKAEAGISLQLSRSLNNDIPNDNYFETPLQAVAQAPITPLRDCTGHYTTEPTALYFNPLVETEFTTSNIYTFRTIGNIYGEYHFIPSLSMRVEAGGDITNLSQDRYSGSGSNYGQSVGGYGEVFTNTVENYDVKLLLKYNRTFKQKHETEGWTTSCSKPFRPKEIFGCLSRHLDLRYLRRERAALSDAGLSETPMDPAALAALPEDLRRELLDALVALDTDRIDALVGRVAERDAALGQFLRQHADNFDYDSIAKMLSPVEEPGSGG